jgi:hypothetical protein
VKIHYICDCCGEPIDTLELDEVDEAKLGFDCLTGAERQDMIQIDAGTNSMQVRSLCDFCIEAMGLADPGYTPAGTHYLH